MFTRRTDRKTCRVGARSTAFVLCAGLGLMCAASAQEGAGVPSPPQVNPSQQTAPTSAPLQVPPASGSAIQVQTSKSLSQADVELVLTLLRTTLFALHQANLNGNHTVLRDLAAPAFHDRNFATNLGQIFAPLRQARLDLGKTVFLDPQVSQVGLTPQGLLRLAGRLATYPAPVSYEMLFQPVDGVWRLFSISASQQQSPLPKGEPPSALSPSQANTAAVQPAPKPSLRAPTTAKRPPNPAAPKPSAPPSRANSDPAQTDWGRGSLGAKRSVGDSS